MVSILTGKIAALFSHRFEQWLSKRMPACNSIKLTNRNIFIVPTRFGFVFIFFILLVFLLGTNYQNNVIILFSYLLASFFITAMLHCYYNLSGLELAQHKTSKGHAEQSINIEVVVESLKARNKLRFSYKHQIEKQVDTLEVGRTLIQVPFISKRRGKQVLGRLKVSSEFAFGLFYAWTQVDLASEIIVYPKLLPLEKHKFLSTNPIDSSIKDTTISNHHFRSGIDDFYGLRAYQHGESLAHIAWKQAAKGQEWQTKIYENSQSSEQFLSLDQMPANTIEDKLSMLCFLILEYNQLGIKYGLDLANEKIIPDTGSAHLSHCLVALALFGNSND